MSSYSLYFIIKGSQGKNSGQELEAEAGADNAEGCA